MIIRLAALRDQARHRPRGYLEEVLAAGQVRGANLVISQADYARLVRHYRPRLAGDLVHQALAPLARWLDQVLGTRLATCAACDRRRNRLNQWHQAARTWLRRT